MTTVDSDPRYVDASEYRTLMGGFPTGVVVVTTTGDDGTPYGLTCSSLSSVTVQPPTLQVCLMSTSKVLAAILGNQRFAVNLLHARAREAASVFASPVDRFAVVPWRPTPRLGLPWLHRDAFAVAECRLTRTLEIGDHTMLFGEVAAVDHADDVPLLYGRRQYSVWPGD
ncbi:flavin reductase family protein [Streptomyces sp. NPDC020362]|uniref:flavin reductase family protein n=1 Tax=unclassified Streptomyces TaxID=2593676 RepID=UPI0034009CAD